MQWRYYLVKVWPFQGLLSGPCFFNMVKNILKVGTSAHLFLQKKAAQNIQGLISGPSLPFYVAKDLDQIISPTWTRQ